MAKLDPTKPPNHLSATMRRWWSHIVSTYELESQHLRLLQLACEAWDVGAAAREAIEAEGLTYADRFGVPRARPEIAIERDSRLAFCRCLREIGLDSTDVDSRPPRIGGARY
jgi:P27 family predicted phage terminase small subunit